MIYLCAPRTGLPEQNTPAIRGAATTLRSLGYLVIEPVMINEIFLGVPYSPQTKFIQTYPGLRADLIAFLSACDGIALMPAWEKARGCCLEVAIAIVFGYTFVHWQTGEVIPRPRHVVITHGYGEEENKGPGSYFDECAAILQLVAAMKVLAPNASSLSQATGIILHAAARESLYRDIIRIYTNEFGHLVGRKTFTSNQQDDITRVMEGMKT